MNIIWAKNPLTTVVQLDDFDKKLLWYRIKSECLEEAIGQAHFDLDPKHQEWCKTALKERCPTDFIADARRHLDYLFICGDEKRNDKSFHEYISELTQEYVTELAAYHTGDCTCVPCSCLKCRAEELVGTDTIAGLGKHEASFIAGAFTGKDGTVRDLDEALIYLKDYEPKNVAEWGKPHVSRWREEAARAYRWLSDYKREHFTNVDS